MKRLLTAVALFIGLSLSAFATDVTIQSQVIPNFQYTGSSQVLRGTINVTHDSAILTFSTSTLQRFIGLGGYKIVLGTTEYEVKSTDSATQITMQVPYQSTTGSVSYTIYPVLQLRIFSSIAFQPTGKTYVVQTGSIDGPDTFYKRVGCTLRPDSTLVIPQLVLDGTTDVLNLSVTAKPYSAYWFTGTGERIRPYDNFNPFWLSSTNLTPTWADILQNNATHITRSEVDINAYTVPQTDALVQNLQGQLDKLQQLQVMVEDYGAVADATRAVGTMSNGAFTLSSTTSVFAQTDIGKVIYVEYAGALTATGSFTNGMLKTTIASYVSATQVTLTSAAQAYANNVYFYFGTDNTAAFTAAAADLVAMGGGGLIKLGHGNYIVTQVTIPSGVSIEGVGLPHSSPGFNTQVWSAYGDIGSNPIDGIFRTRFRLNGSNLANITLKKFGIVALDKFQFQSCFDEVGGTYVRLEEMYLYRCHFGVVFDQTELSSIKNSIFEAYDPSREFGISGAGVFRAGLDPTSLGFNKTGSATSGIEPMVYPDDCYQCGRITLNTTVSNDATYFTRTLATNSFIKGFYFKTKVPEVLSFGGGKAATQAIDDGHYRYEIRWTGYSGLEMGFNVNGTGTYTQGLSGEVALAVQPGGATAQIIKTGSTGIDTVLGTVSGLASTSAGIFFGDLDATTSFNANTYWQAFEWEPSWPRSAQWWGPAGDDHWQSRQTIQVDNAGSIRAGDNQIICQACSQGVGDIGKTVALYATSDTRGLGVSGTVTAYYGDAFGFLVSNVAPGDTTIHLDRDMGNQKHWFYASNGTASESMFCTGTSGNDLTGCTRGLNGTTALAFVAGDGKTRSWNVYRTWVISTTSSNSFTLGSVVYAPAAGPEFVNVIQIYNNQFNGGTVQVADDGGYTHKFFGNNHNGGGNAYRISASHEVSIENQDFESQSSHTIVIGGNGLKRVSTSGSPFSISLSSSLVGTGSFASAVRTEAGNNLNFYNNTFPGGFGFAISNTTAGSVGRINSAGNNTLGSRLFQQKISGYVEGGSLGGEIPYEANGGMGLYDWSYRILRPRTGPLELHYQAVGAEEEPRGALGTVSALSTALAITVKNSETRFYATDVGKTIQIEYANTPDASNYVLTTTIAAYVDPTHVTLATPAITAVNLVNTVWYRKGAKTPAITFYDAYDLAGTNSVALDGSTGPKTDPTAPNSAIVPSNKWARIQGLTGYTQNQTVYMLDASGYMALSSALLGNNQWVYTSPTGLLKTSANATMDDSGNGMVRYLAIKAANASGTNTMLDFKTSGNLLAWSWLYDVTGGWLTLQDGNASRQQMTVIANATYDYLQLHANEGINWAGYGTTYTSAGGIAKNGSSMLEINRGKKIADGGATGDLILRNLRMQLSGASSAVYFNYTGTPTAARAIAMPDMSSTFVGSNGVLIAGRIPFGVAIDSGVGLTDSSQLTYAAPTLTLAATHTGGSGTLMQINLTKPNVDQLAGWWQFNTNTDVSTDFFGKFGYKFDGGTSNPSRQFQIYVGDSSTPKMVVGGTGLVGIGTISAGAMLQIQTSGTGVIGQIIKATAGQTADLFQAQNSAGTALSGFNASGSLWVVDTGSTISGGVGFIQVQNRFEAGSNVVLNRNLLSAIGTAAVRIRTSTGATANTLDIEDDSGLLQSSFSPLGTLMFGSAKLIQWSSTAVTGGSKDLGLERISAGLIGVNSGTAGTWRDLKLRQLYADATMTAGGTTGAQTINKSAGSVNFAAAATSLVVTDSLVTASSIVICTVQTNDATMKDVACVPTAGSFTIYANAAATAETKVAFIVINQ